jgi:adenosine deaminase
LVRDRGVVLELCPTSNFLTQAVTSLREHPLKRLYEYGIRTTINTDDPGIFNTNLNREYRIAHEILGMSLNDLRTCARYADEARFKPAQG